MFLTSTGQMVYTIEEQNTGFPQEGYINPIDLGTELYNFPVRYTHFPRHNLTKNFLRTDVDEVGKTLNLPFVYKSIERYVGEDVMLDCFGETNWEIMWKFNGTYISEFESRHSIDELETQFQGALIKISTLLIQVLRKEDYGTYECHYSKSNDWAQHTYVIGVHVLKEIPRKIVILNLDVGVYIQSLSFFCYYANETTSSISIEYTINNQSVDTVCSEFSTWHCALTVKNFHTYKLPYIGLVEMNNDSNYKRTNIEYCLCLDAFGIHRIYFHRTKRYSLKSLSIQHPYVLVVLPHTKPSLFRYFDDSKHYIEIDTLLNSNETVETKERKLQPLLHLVRANESKARFVENLLQNVALLCAFLCAIGFLSFVIDVFWGVYYNGISHTLQGCLPYCLQPTILENPRSVFISHSEEDKDFITRTLAPFLDESLNLRVSFSGKDDDFESNHDVFNQLSEKIEHSDKLLVVLSSAYHEEEQCEKLELMIIIWGLLNNRTIKSKNILCIFYNEGAKLPLKFLRHFYFKKLHWNNQLSEEEQLLFIQKWLTTGRL
ncbi:hypothetical protein DPMN_096803 [Dreissena polymorpha]|uniref:TIR domain-containing protein n=1 Tax=Dreissena polymorpha TaxID=45954 RepID=A0A9D4R5S2_DREPO|nr:hypothetical protein DPMN_096803 [Dreissena polymorpha]